MISEKKSNLNFENYSYQEVEAYNISNISNSAIVSKYFDWQISSFIKYLKGKHVIEIGAGIGTISERLVLHAESLMVTDISEKCLKEARAKLGSSKSKCGINFSTYKMGGADQSYFKKETFDAAVCINVLEHIKNDIYALTDLKKILFPGGKILLLVPAIPSIYGSVDKALGHYRRYSKEKLTHALTAAGYHIISIKYINFLGILGWWINSKILKRKIIPKSNFFVFRFCLPIIKIIESIVKLPLGLSIIAVAEKK